MTVSLCSCTSDLPVSACCGPFLDATSLPPTALATMRSRYAAFATGNSDHLFRTWHPKTRPAGDIETGDGWEGLEILDVVDGGEGDTTGIVEFIARNVDGDMRERSRFEKRAGRWFYVDAIDLDWPEN